MLVKRMKVCEPMGAGQGLSNLFPGPHSWIATPGPRDTADPNFDASVYDTSGVRDVHRLSPPLFPFSYHLSVFMR